MERPPWYLWYGHRAWKTKARDQLYRKPLCEMCKRAGRTTSASVADHVVPHRGDEVKFWFGELQSLCWPCHSRFKQREERGSVQTLDDDGWPLI